MSEQRGGIEEAISFGYFLGKGVADVVITGIVKPTVYGLSELAINKKK